MAVSTKVEDISPSPVLVFQAMKASVKSVNAAETGECAAAGVASDVSLLADPTSILAERFQSLMAPPLMVSEAAPECFIVF